MKKIVTMLNTVTFISTLKKAEIERLRAFSPEALNLKNEEGKNLYTIQTSENASISPFGATFNEETNKGFASLTITVDAEDETPKEFVSKRMFKELDYIQLIEKQAEKELKALDKAEKAVAKTIDEINLDGDEA